MLAQQRLGDSVTSFELMARSGVAAVVEHGNNVRDPLGSPHPWYVLFELSSQSESGLRQSMEELLADAAEKGFVQDATIADSLEQAKAFWYIREFFGEVQRRLGASIKHDISVPVSAVPAFIEEANAAVIKLIPGCQPLPFGHAGDGNIHYNVTQPPGADKEAFLARWHEVNEVVFEVVNKLGGSISAEHGVGVLKRDELPRYKDATALALMQAVKRALDPLGMMNPGRVLLG
jgi:D-lactate dehydrogenase (cytochrome)